ncbi:hypothetical protein HYFRA_00007637 [Hymenoscyphus fraxineus]|uniref:Uncharacterized protein n=1 Tax=Hymenoscyphus fraxineus TaxID=746836 RepID=A0A9N9KU28_9HELO|nr:hypothetical protein HYFRA_00007637 [Hymenoscyphus fraxineus]
MLQYARAELVSLLDQMSPVVELLGNYWLFYGQNLPDLLRILVSEADSPPRKPNSALDNNYGLPIGIPIPCQMDLNLKNNTPHPPPLPRKRSHKVSRKEKPEPLFERGDNAWLKVKFESGRYKVTIDSDGEWKNVEWRYRVRDSNGDLYDNGDLVSEDDLYSSEK